MNYLYKTLLTIFLIINLHSFSQEIPNGGFESWTPTLFWSLNPTDWTTDNTEVTAPVYPDSSAFSGELAMTLVPDVDGLGEGNAQAKVIVDITYVPEALEFYARWDYVAGQVGLSITFFNEENAYFTETWSPEEFESDWQLIQMPLPQIEPIITHAEIVCWAEVGDLAVATVSFDDLQWGTISSVEEIDENSLTLSPNPCNQYLNINLDQDLHGYDTQITIFDAIGREVYSGNYTPTLSLDNFSEGQYLMRLTSDRDVITKKFIVQR